MQFYPSPLPMPDLSSCTSTLKHRKLHKRPYNTLARREKKSEQHRFCARLQHRAQHNSITNCVETNIAPAAGFCSCCPCHPEPPPQLVHIQCAPRVKKEHVEISTGITELFLILLLKVVQPQTQSYLKRILKARISIGGISTKPESSTVWSASCTRFNDVD